MHQCNTMIQRLHMIYLIVSYVGGGVNRFHTIVTQFGRLFWGNFAAFLDGRLERGRVQKSLGNVLPGLWGLSGLFC